MQQRLEKYNNCEFLVFRDCLQKYKARNESRNFFVCLENAAKFKGKMVIV